MGPQSKPTLQLRKERHGPVSPSSRAYGVFDVSTRWAHKFGPSNVFPHPSNNTMTPEYPHGFRLLGTPSFYFRFECRSLHPQAIIIVSSAGAESPIFPLGTKCRVLHTNRRALAHDNSSVFVIFCLPLPLFLIRNLLVFNILLHIKFDLASLFLY